MEPNHNRIERSDLQKQIDDLERQLDANPSNAEELQYYVSQIRAFMNELFDKPLEVIEEEYRVLMQEHAEGKSISGDVLMAELKAML